MAQLVFRAPPIPSDSILREVVCQSLMRDRVECFSEVSIYYIYACSDVIK